MPYTQYLLSGTVLQDQLVCPIIWPRILIVFGPFNFTFIPENWQIQLVFVPSLVLSVLFFLDSN